MRYGWGESMTAQEFVKEWCVGFDAVNAFDAAAVQALTVSQETKDFLIHGLPIEAAPFLTFGPIKGSKFSKHALPRASDIYQMPSIPGQYRIIGMDGSGNPICLDIEKETIVCLRHEDGFSPAYMNCSLAMLMRFLLVVRRKFEKTAFPAGNAEVQKMLAADDPRALKKGYWWQEALLALIE